MKVRIETEVELDLEMMAKAFSDMDSEKQADFLGMAYREMATYTRRGPDGAITRLGSMGRENQMSMIGEAFKRVPDAKAFLDDLLTMTRESGDGIVLDGTIPSPARAAEIRAWLNDNVGQDPSWNNPASTPLADVQAMSAKLKAGMERKEVFDPKVAGLLIPSGGGIKFAPLTVIATSIRWSDMNKTKHPLVTCTCEIGSHALLVGDNVSVATGSEVTVGTVVRVNAADKTVDVLLEQPKGDPAVTQPPTQERTCCKSNMKQHHCGSCAQPADPNQRHRFRLDPESTLDKIEAEAKKLDEHGFISHRIFPNEQPVKKQNVVWNGEEASVDIPPESPNADTCGECGGSGEWKNPAGGRNAVTPCSKGCKKP